MKIPEPLRNLPVIVPKGNDIRLCIEIRCAIKAVIRVKHPSPTINDIFRSVQDPASFTKLGLKSGFHQPESLLASHSVTIISNWKRKKRYKTLIPAIYSPQEELHDTFREIFRA